MAKIRSREGSLTWVDAVVICWCVLLIGIGLAYAMLHSFGWPLTSDKTATLIGGAFGSLVASFAGASAAFLFNARHAAKKQFEQDVEACNRALLVLVRQINFLININAYISPAAQFPDRRYKLQPLQPVDMAHLRVKAEELAFLVGTEATELPLAFVIQDDKFHNAMAAINLHSRLHIESVQPIFERWHTRNKTTEIRPDHMDARLGPRLAHFLLQSTEDIFKLVPATIKSHEATMVEAKALLTKLMPGGRFIIGREPLGDDPPKSALARL